ncbi:MAG: cell division protein FtsQ, partial [Deltaproteobacteria bacterium]|nr:cell division protein FtsQ [Deltaproteobacteria bacterium]
VLGGLYYVDAEGFVFKEVGESEPADLLLLTGLRQEDLVAEPHANRMKFQEALRLGELAEGRSLALSEVRFVSAAGVVLYPADYPVALHMGWGDWERKLQRLEQVLALWQGRENRLAALHVDFSDQVVARSRGTEGLEVRLRKHG